MSDATNAGDSKDFRTYMSEIGGRGGMVSSATKRAAAKENLRKAREAKALYRNRPDLKPNVR